MPQTCTSDVILYHDETKNVPGQNFKGHVLFFVPTRLIVESQAGFFGVQKREYFPQEEISKRILDYREKFKFKRKFHYTALSGKTWGYYDRAYLRVMQMAVESLRHKSPAKTIFRHPLHCKLAVMFYPRGADLSLYGRENEKKERRLRHDETILRMLLKGAAHYLYSETERVKIKKIIADGDSAHRDFDDQRILERLLYDGDNGRSPLRDYVSFDKNISIRHLPSDHRQYPEESVEFRHANLLQVTDLLLGSTIRACYTGSKPSVKYPAGVDYPVDNKKDIVAQPVRELLGKKVRGGNFKYSGHYRSFTVNQVSFSADGISFKDVNVKTPILSDERNLC